MLHPAEKPPLLPIFMRETVLNMWWELATVKFLTCSSCAHSNWHFLVSFLSFLSPSRLRRISCRFARYSRMVACWVLNLSSNSSVESSRGLEVGLWGGSMCMLVTHSGLPTHDTIEAHTGRSKGSSKDCMCTQCTQHLQANMSTV